MTESQITGLCLLAAIMGTLFVFGLWADRRTRNHPKRNKRTGLPRPSKESTRYCTPRAVPSGE